MKYNTKPQAHFSLLLISLLTLISVTGAHAQGLSPDDCAQVLNSTVAEFESDVLGPKLQGFVNDTHHLKADENCLKLDNLKIQFDIANSKSTLGAGESNSNLETALEKFTNNTAKLEVLEEGKKQGEESKKFLGFNWGLGVGASFGLGSDRIEAAELVNDIVRVTEEVTNTPRIVLEIHNFHNQWATNNKTWGVGPFAAVNFGASDGDTLTSFGAGYMYGVKRNNGSGSFNVGLGLMLDRKVQQLGDGIENGMPLPMGETEIRFKKESELAVLLFVSTTFD